MSSTTFQTPDSTRVPLSQFELEREARIAKNLQRMRDLGIEKLKLPTPFAPVASPTPRKRQRKELIPESERRRTSRVVRKINYAEDRITGGEEDEHAATRRRNLQNQQRSQRNATRVSRRSVYSVGGRVYDSEKGTTCHWCRQKTVETHVECTGYECQNEAARPVQFCGMCLRNRHGEDIDLAVASGCWECPKCRKSCGEGCDNCCNCGPCRKKAGLAPTHQVIRIARENGFDNVHDYLVWEKVGGTPESIKMRKKKFSWGQWVFDETLCAKCPAEETEEEETKEEEVSLKTNKKVDEVDDDDDEEDSDGSSDGDDCFKIVPSARIYTMNNIKF